MVVYICNPNTGRLRQEDHRFEAILGYIAIPCLKKNQNNEWIKKMCYLYTMEFYAAMKKNEMLSFAGKWMELENIILCEVSLAQKTKNRMFSLICGH
jgi:hypothetical protein